MSKSCQHKIGIYENKTLLKISYTQNESKFLSPEKTQLLKTGTPIKSHK